ncbi:NAD(P)H-dependent glycerol-3-phosphate dehydrogenase [bacterium]|nr:NAD(P)H-dependent glycerol-3-phosphate dehydrogenase [bacterium]
MIGIAGAGAFGTALAVALGREGREVRLWARDPDHVAAMVQSRQNTGRLPGVILPDSVSVTAQMADLGGAEVVLLALPMQSLAAFLQPNAGLLDGTALVACCKGVDLGSLRGPSALIERFCPDSAAAILTGPSFAADIARGLPTALTLACARPEAEDLQRLLSTATLRLYRSSDVVGAELGGALKNIIAIAAGVVTGAGLGESARAALITRGFAEMQRLALHHGARAETLSGLSGFGDLVLTCTSTQSRNLRYGLALGSGQAFDARTTVEGVATAQAVSRLAASLAIDMPVAGMVARLIAHDITLDQAIRSLMSRPLKEE